MNTVKSARRVVIMGSQAWAMANFWPTLIRETVARGHELICLNPATGDPTDAEAEASLRALGAQTMAYPIKRKGLNPLADLIGLWRLRRIFTEIQPDVLFAYAIKPVIWGTLAAALAGVPHRYAMITGLGFTFERDTFLKKCLNRAVSWLYRLAISRCRGVFFQNNDDRETFARAKIIRSDSPVHMSRGTGVDLDYFAPRPVRAGAPVFLLVARLLIAKGLREFAAAAKMLKQSHPEARFQILGPADTSPAGVPLPEVQAWQAAGYIEYLGVTSDVRPYLDAATVMVLPSWREGTPCSILEGLSVGRAAVVTDVPGCREVVADGVNGLRVPLHDVPALTAAMERYILEPELAARQGAAGRELAETEFDARKVSFGLLSVMGL